MHNKEIRSAAKNAGVHLWEVAVAYGINDGNFSRKLRQELPQEEKEKILAIIDRLSREKREAI
jgi:hypothetical protein